MILRITILLAALLTGACDQATQAPSDTPTASAAQSGCDKSAKQIVAFTAPDAADVVEARAFGATCAQAVVMLVVRSADGAPLSVWSTAHPWLGAGAQADGDAALDSFLSEWVKVKVDTTTSLPDWPQRATAFKDQLSAFMTTPFDRDAYLDIRAKGAPRLCFATGVSSGQCLYYDVKAGAAPKVLDING
jgi:hypothetical protein